MKFKFSILFTFLFVLGFSQGSSAIDSSQYNIGYTVGENLPVALLMIVAIFFIYKSYRSSKYDSNKGKTDFMDDGTIEK